MAFKPLAKPRTPTSEQQAAISDESPVIVGNAFAGTGKTTMAEDKAKALIAKYGPGVLYLAFNKALQLEGERRMPEGVTCKTTHSIAWPVAIRLFGRDGARNKVGNNYPSFVAREMGCPPFTAVVMLGMVNNFTASLDREVGEQHIPAEMREKVAGRGSVGIVVDGARKLWDMMCDPANERIKLPHDGYLKIYQMGAPHISGYHSILFDEAQDANPCTLDVVMRQTHMRQRVIVGDRHQAIYQFRGSVDALSLVEGSQHYLTQSWRFGPTVAGLANRILMGVKGERYPLIGMSTEPGALSVDTDSPYAVIARTNAGLFGAAVTRLHSGAAFHFIGVKDFRDPQEERTDTYKFGKLLDALRLRNGTSWEIKDPYVKSFDSFGVMREFGELIQDPEIKFLCKMVDNYGDELPELIDQIKDRHRPVREGGLGSFDGIVFTTGHKSKGLEFDQVVLMEDFPGFTREGKRIPLDDLKEEDLNLLYVATTRARKAIQICPALEELIDLQNQEGWDLDAEVKEALEARGMPVGGQPDKGTAGAKAIDWHQALVDEQQGGNADQKDPFLRTDYGVGLKAESEPRLSPAPTPAVSRTPFVSPFDRLKKTNRPTGPSGSSGPSF